MLLNQWEELVMHLPHAPTRWRQKTRWRLTAHLARASTVENASLCLHSLFGFPVLTGFGLKGLARAQALQTGYAPDDIHRVFGPENAQKAGSVDFLESWPERWPQLELDIVNSHHQAYYRNAGDCAPGDWETPTPTYFLAVPPPPPSASRSPSDAPPRQMST